MAIFEKKPLEALTFEIDLTGQLPDAVTLAASGHTAKAYNDFDQEVTTDILASATVTVDIANNLARFATKAGAGQPIGRYWVVLNLILSSGGPIEETCELLIRANRRSAL